MRKTVVSTIAVVVMGLLTSSCGKRGEAKAIDELKDRCADKRAGEDLRKVYERMTACELLATGALTGRTEEVRWFDGISMSKAREYLSTQCELERTTDAKHSTSSGCIRLALWELIDKPTARAYLKPICEKHLETVKTDCPTCPPLNLEAKPRKNGSVYEEINRGWACTLLIQDAKSHPGEPEALSQNDYNSLLTRGCALGSSTYCLELSKSPDANVAADGQRRLLEVTKAKCPQGNMQACRILGEVAGNDPSVPGIIANGKRADDARRRANAEEVARLRARERERREERREERAREQEREERHEQAQKDMNAQFMAGHQALLQQSAENQRTFQANLQNLRKPAQSPPPSAPAAPSRPATPSAPLPLSRPPTPSAPPPPPQKTPAERQQILQTCMQRLPPETIPSRGDGFGVPEGAIRAAISAVSNCKGGGPMGAPCVGDVKSALSGARGGSNLAGWAGDMDRAWGRANAVGSGPWMQNKPSCSANSQHVRSLNTWCFDAQQAKATCKGALDEALGDVQCAAKLSHWADEASSAQDYARAKEEHTKKCQDEAAK